MYTGAGSGPLSPPPSSYNNLAGAEHHASSWESIITKPDHRVVDGKRRRIGSRRGPALCVLAEFHGSLRSRRRALRRWHRGGLRGGVRATVPPRSSLPTGYADGLAATNVLGINTRRSRPPRPITPRCGSKTPRDVHLRCRSDGCRDPDAITPAASTTSPTAAATKQPQLLRPQCSRLVPISGTHCRRLCRTSLAL